MSECLVYRNIRYAEAERFGPAQNVTLESAHLNRARGPVAPQAPSRLACVTGAQQALQQSEHCQVLSVFTPECGGKRPVMVWYHGGAFVTGGGELPWYDGERLAAEQDVVVVSISYRLGVLGYLAINGLDQPSPGLSDQLAALVWIHKNIHEFGGDPDNLILFGQSAGGFSIRTMLRWGVDDYVRGVILQSPALSMSPLAHYRSNAEQITDQYLALLGGEPHRAAIEDILHTQSVLPEVAGRAELWAPWGPESDDALRVPVIAGYTADDMLPFVALRHGHSTLSVEDVDRFSNATRELTEEAMRSGIREVVNEATSNGYDAWLYRFSRPYSPSNWAAPHCIEVPYLLGTRESWSDAPMMADADWCDVDRRGVAIRAQWASFAWTLNPGSRWSKYGSTEKITELDGADASCVPHAIQGRV